MDDFDGTDNTWSPPPAWQTHPSAVGYVRGNQSSGNSAGTQGAAMDSGTRNGTPADELARLSNSGTEENPTSAQPAPTPRAEQAAGGAGGGGGAANPGPRARGGGAGGDLLGDIISQQRAMGSQS